MDIAFEKDPETGDYKMSMVDGDIKFVEGQDYVSQKIESRLCMIKGEWAWDKRLGLPIFSKEFRRPQYIDTAMGYIRDQIKDVSEVEQLNSLTLEKIENNRPKISFSVTDSTGEEITGDTSG